LALVLPEEEVVEVQVDLFQVGVPFRVGVGVDLHRMVLVVPWAVVLRIFLDLV